MAIALKEAVKEKIEIIGHLNENITKKGFKLQLLIPAALVVASATGTFFVVRRVLKNKAA